MEIKPWYLRDDKFLRIGFAGSAGTGKTTLMHAVNEHLDLPVIQTSVRKWQEKNRIDVHDLSGKALMKFQMQILDQMIAEESVKEQFITDRTTLDRMCYALYYLSNDPDMQRGLLDYVDTATRHAALHYDIIFTLPFGGIPFEADGVRKDMQAHQLTIHMLIEHTVALGSQMFGVYQVHSTDLEERVAEVLSVVESLKKRRKEHVEDSK